MDPQCKPKNKRKYLYFKLFFMFTPFLSPFGGIILVSTFTVHPTLPISLHNNPSQKNINGANAVNIKTARTKKQFLGRALHFSRAYLSQFIYCSPSLRFLPLGISRLASLFLSFHSSSFNGSLNVDWPISHAANCATVRDEGAAPTREDLLYGGPRGRIPCAN